MKDNRILLSYVLSLFFELREAFFKRFEVLESSDLVLWIFFVIWSRVIMDNRRFVLQTVDNQRPC